MRWPFTGRGDAKSRATAALRDTARDGVLVTGPAYVGRTRFVREVASSLRRTPRVVLHISRSGRDIPFAGLGELAPPDPGRPDTWMAFLRDRIPAGAVLVADDAQWLDDHSATALVHLAASKHVKLLASIRDGHRVPGAIDKLWRDDLVLRLDLDPLDREGVETVLEAALDGPVGAETRRELWAVSQGFPRLLREMTEDAVERGALVRDDGVWVMDGPALVPRRTVDAVRQLLQELGPEVERAIQLIAVGEPLDAAVLDQLVDADTLERIELAGMVVADPVTNRYAFRAPGACMAVHAALAPARVRALCRELATVADGDLAELDGGDLLRYVRWHLDAGEVVPPTELIRASAVAAAHFDHPVAERLARAALPDGGAPALVRLAGALVAQDRAAEAEQALAEAVASASHDGERLEAVAQRAQLLMFVLGRGDQALRSLREAIDTLASGPARQEATTLLAFLVSLDGDLASSIELSRPVVHDTDAHPATRVFAAASLSFALGMRGELDAALEVVDLAASLPEDEVRARQPLGPHLNQLTRMMCHLYSGELTRAETIGHAAYDAALAAEADEVAGVWATQIAGFDLYAGRISHAAARAGEARRLLSSADAIGALPLACAQGSMAAAESGDEEGAAVWLERLVTHRRMADARANILEGRARAALAAARGELADAARLAVEVGSLALGMDHKVWAALALHQAVRYGYPEEVLPLLERAGEGVDGQLVPTLVLHGRASAAGDVDALEQASLQFGEIGTLLYAAEAAAQAARFAAREQHAQRASGLRARARSLLDLCPGAQTPALVGLEGEPLTRREREIALLAARGQTSREIAERLYLSTRTVDNHLANVYRKLGVSGRDELPAALAVDAG